MARTWLHNRIATSQFTLPVCAVLGAVPWLCRLTAGGCAPLEVWLTAAVAAATAYLLMELNNRHALIRVRSRAMASLFWLFSAFFFAHLTAAASCLLLIAAVGCLFTTYEAHEPVVAVFHSFLLLGLAAWLQPVLVVCVPLFWLYLIINMRAFTLRTLSASLIALLFATLIVFPILIFELLPIFPSGDWFLTGDYHLTLDWLVVTALGLVSLLRYLVSALEDKLKTRLLMYVLVAQWVAAQLAIALSPAHFDALMPVLWLFTAPLLSHHLAFGRSVWSAVWFWTVVIGLVALVVWCGDSLTALNMLRTA